MHAHALILSCTLAALVPAQERPLPLLGKFTVPLHTAPDDPVGGAYGLWAVGHDYKVSFHEGFRFFPLLGPEAPRNLPLAWRTEAVRFGDQPLFEGGDTRGGRDGDWRYQFRHPGVVEAYEIRADGVEQSFTVLSGPATGGDLRVTGVMDTDLVPLAQSWDLDVQLADERKVPRILLRAATGFDARGRRLAVQRSFQGGMIELRVSAAELGKAQYPIMLRQLTEAVPILDGSQYLDIDFAAYKEGFVVFSRHSAQTDLDTFGWRLGDPSTQGAFWMDATASWDSERPRICGVVGQHMYVAVARIYANPIDRRVLAYQHPIANVGSTGINSGDFFWAAQTPGFTQRRPEIAVSFVGGLRLAWQEDQTQTNANTQTTRVCVSRFDQGFDAKWIVAESPNFDAENPVLVQEYVIWQQRPNLNFLPSRIVARLVDGNGPAPGPSLHVSAAHPDHGCVQPRAAQHGVLGLPLRCVIAYEFSLGTVQGIAAVRIESGSITHTRELSSSSQAHELLDIVAGGTAQHWLVLYGRGAKLEAKRLGRTLGTVESLTVHEGPVSAACSGASWSLPFPPPAGPVPLPLLYVRGSAPDAVMLRTMAFDPDAAVNPYGNPCGGTLGKGILLPFEPYAGGELRLSLEGAPAGAICQLWIALGPGSSVLPGWCEFLLDGSAAVAHTFTASGFAFGDWLTIPLIDDPLFIGNLYLQGTWQDPTFPSITKATNGIEARIR